MITVRKATQTDLDELAVLFDAYRQFYEQQPDLAAAKAFLKERLLHNESEILIAFDEDKPAGFTQLYPIFSSVGLKRTWLLNDLFVAASARKQGVATALLTAAKEHGVQTGAKWLLLETAPTNSKAQALYEKNGWQKVEDIFYQYDL